MKYVLSSDRFCELKDTSWWLMIIAEMIITQIITVLRTTAHRINENPERTPAENPDKLKVNKDSLCEF